MMSHSPDSGLEPPIIVVIEGHDVELYPTVESAMLDMEGVDVEDGIYQVFDAQGRRINIRAEGVRRWMGVIDIGTVHFDSAESTPTGADELRTVLVEHLRSVNVPCDLHAELATLLRLVRERHRC